ncbi:oligopeptide/dipeptide ABC transporter ATP-binding protein [Dactylosporangium sp. CA-092794]|uniref:oligopeptide/dipeptide ABC transporter ATP-binding protein n=1 Tax=Dactylosporangium sp. CA-092794 TaxID=3239929 RepID=UPI003D916929
MTELLSVRGLRVDYPQGRRRPPFTALRDVDLDVAPGETVGIVGESGSGKSTLGNAVLGTAPVTEGRIVFEGEDITRATRARRRRLTRDIQVVFQDPFGSLNPMRTIGQTLEEPLLVHRPQLGRRERRREVEAALVHVGLSAGDAARFPANFSGGQRQRIAIARALILRPKLIICDEAVSALDLSVQAKILNLLRELRQEFGMAYLFISHDMSVVRHMSDRVLVLYQGQAMERGPAADVCADPRHPYTVRLLAAAPVPDPVEQRLRRQVGPSAETAPPPRTGCPYRYRCGRADDACAAPLPVSRLGERTVHCHHPLGDEDDDTGGLEAIGVPGLRPRRSL